MLLGEYFHTVDPKGRIILPAKFREELGSNFVITKGLDQCLFIYPQSEWNKLEEKLKQLPLVNAKARSFVRFFFAGAAEADCDKQGRVLLPGNLREYANLQKEVITIGVSTRVEIWNKEDWEEYNKKLDSEGTAFAEGMAELGI